MCANDRSRDLHYTQVPGHFSKCRYATKMQTALWLRLLIPRISPAPPLDHYGSAVLPLVAGVAVTLAASIGHPAAASQNSVRMVQRESIRLWWLCGMERGGRGR